MKSIGLCIGLLVISMIAVFWVRSGGDSLATPIETQPVHSTLANTPAELETATQQPKIQAAPDDQPAESSPVSSGTVSKDQVPKDVAPKDVAPEDAVTNDEAPKNELQIQAADRTAKPTKEPIDPRTRGVVIKKSSAAARAKGEITFDDLQFAIVKDAKFSDQMLDDDVKSLDGLNVRLNGYILPTTLFKETDIDQFVLVRDNQECCFGPGAALFDCVIVEMQDGKTTDFVTRPVTVYGKLKIDTKKYKYPGGKGPRGTTHFAIFRIEGQKVQ